MNREYDHHMWQSRLAGSVVLILLVLVSLVFTTDVLQKDLFRRLAAPCKLMYTDCYWHKDTLALVSGCLLGLNPSQGNKEHRRRQVVQ